MAHTLEEIKRIVGRSLKKDNPFPKLNEVVTPKKIALALSVDIQVVVDNWDVRGPLEGFQEDF